LCVCVVDLHVQNCSLLFLYSFMVLFVATSVPLSVCVCY
jgi:hypothetical protein